MSWLKPSGTFCHWQLASAPVLTTLAALGLAIIMALASIYHMRRKELPTAPIVLLLLAGFVVYGRGFL